MTPSWPGLPIHELGVTVTGRTPTTSRPELFGEDYPFVTPRDMDGRRTISETARGISGKGAAALRGKLVPKGSVAVSCIGWQLGKVAMLGADAFTNQQLNTIIPNERVDPEYLYYHLITRRGEIQTLGAIGTRTPILKKSAFERIEVPVPPLGVQRKIAALLVPYDDLVANNYRRKAVLLEMAARLYHVYAHRANVTEAALGDLITIEKGRKPARVMNVRSGGYLPHLLLDTIERGVQSFASVERMVIAQPMDVVIVADGARSGVAFTGLNGVVGSTLARLRSTEVDRLSPFQLILLLLEREQELRSKNVGSAIPHLNKEYLRRLRVPVLSPEDTKELHKRVGPIFRLIWNLREQSRVAAAARDLVLPRLTAGAIDVTDLNIVMPATAA